MKQFRTFTLTLGIGLSLFLYGCNANGKQQISITNSNSSSTEASSSSISIQGKIINGVEVDTTTSPQIVPIALSFIDGSSGLCSGTVIAPQYILSAGHCFPPAVVSATISTQDNILQVEKVILHPNYQEAPDLNAIFNDVALLYVPNLDLPALPILASQTPPNGSELIVYGYGLDETGTSGQLRSGPSLVAFSTPNHIFSEPFSEERSNTCNGDSGGPAIYTFTDALGNFGLGIVGIVSTGTVNGCSEGDVTLFTNLQGQDILDFIAQNAPGVLIN